MSDQVSIFGIRHHGPGSARRLLEALDELRPQTVLIEGPADATDLMSMLADADMIPPVSLLAYADDDPGSAIFWPFASYSPEYQAACWAHHNKATLRLIDLPANWQLATIRNERAKLDDDTSEDAEDDLGDDLAEDDEEERPSPVSKLRRDPIGVLAETAGYEDGESWWSDVIEENPSPGPVFEAIADAMTALRQHVSADDASDADPSDARNELREAHMRVEIAKACKEASGPIAVICGAWHVPALNSRDDLKADRELLKGQLKTKIAMTWAPWSSARLSFSSGYGAGVTAPGWCKHLWHTPTDRSSSVWLARIAAALRDHGHMVSTASLIEAERLAHSLAAIRERPRVGFEELTQAAISCLCFGEPLLWHQIATHLLIGADVGAIPDNVPLAPLLEDLQRQQRTARLKPEALERELSLDLRSDSGLFRSTLLHRLAALEIPWGTLNDAGRSRGTFRERWTLQWDPEFAVKLVENLIYGSTIEMAADGRLCARIKQEHHLGALAEFVLSAMTAQLKAATVTGVECLQQKAAQTSDCIELLAALPPMANIIRYGEARDRQENELEALASRIAVQAALALPYAARGLDNTAASELSAMIRSADHAINLVELDGEDRQTWQTTLSALVNDPQTTRLVSGAAARLLYDADHLSPEETAILFGRMLSPGTSVPDAAAFFEGFFEGAGQLLLFDDELRKCVDDWVATLDGENFVEYLPLFRRVFGPLDVAERRRLLDQVLGAAAPGLAGLRLASDGGEAWQKHFAILSDILTREAGSGKDD